MEAMGGCTARERWSQHGDINAILGCTYIKSVQESKSTSASECPVARHVLAVILVDALGFVVLPVSLL